MKEHMFNKVRTILAVIIALAIAFVIILFVSDTPLKTIGLLMLGPLKHTRYMGNVVELMIPLVFAGLSTAILFQANLFNLGAEGIFYISGLTAAFVAVLMPVSSKFVHPVVGIVLGVLIGMTIAFVPGYLKAKWNASVLVSSLMLNSILAGIGLYLLNNFIRDKNITEIASLKFPETAKLALLIPGTRIHVGLIICLVAVGLIYLFFNHTKWGYLLKLFGLNKDYTEYSGYSSIKLIIMAHLLAGALAGLGGSVEVLGMYSRFRWASLPGLGFDGALVAMLARNNPIAVLISALFIAYIRTGANIMAWQSDVPAEMVSIVQAIIILLVTAERFLFHWRQKQLLKVAEG